MGGSAFTAPGPLGEPPLNVPRLSSRQYHELRGRYMGILSSLYREVASPPPAPEKESHGDIDILVSDPVSFSSEETISSTLGAIRTINRPNLLHFAIPYHGESNDQVYAQLDVRICATNLKWLTFHESYSDLWSLLGMSIRRYGLTANNMGLYLRIQELESTNWKNCFVFLSDEPATVMHFMGLNAEEYQRGFSTERSLFEWMSASKFVNGESFRHRTENADDKKRERTRPMVRRFVEEWAPTLPEASEAERAMTRESVLADAASFFGVHEEVQAKTAQGIREGREVTAMREIKFVLETEGLKSDKVNLVLRGVSRWVYVHDNGEPAIRDEAELNTEKQIHLGHLLTAEGTDLRSEVTQWFSSHWQEIKEKERARVKAARAERQRETG